MKVLVVGGGGREHALLWKISRDRPDAALLAAPGNAGTAALARNVPVPASDVDGLAALAETEDVDLVVVGPEVALAAGLADRLRAAGRAAFGPGAAAARLEASKAYAKRILTESGVPTAAYGVFRDRAAAGAFAADLGAPCVVKASGLAAGKGAIVCRTDAEARAALDLCLVARAFGEAGDEVVVEEFLEGEELSLLALTDGETLVPFPSSQDHKAAEDGDRGPNTGGMGAVAPVSLVDDAARDAILETVFRPTLAALAADGAPFSGCLYAGLMMTADGPKVLEWNARFGDPECQALLPLLESDLVSLLAAATPGGRLADVAPPRWRPGACVTVVAAAAGYPDAVERGTPIRIPADLASPGAFDECGVVVFHAGTAAGPDGAVVAAGGRVLNATGVGSGVEDARAAAYGALERIDAPGLRWRTDIGWREAARAARG